MKNYKNLKITQNEKGIVRIILNDLETYNSLSSDMIKSLISVFKILNKDQKSKVIIIEGAGKGFCA